MARGRRVLAGAVLAAMLVTALAGCGRRGALEPPPDPSVAATPHPDQLAAVRRPRPIPIKPPDQPFLLDPLL